MSQPLRVLHLLNSLTGYGCGVVNAAIDMISGQLKQGLTVAVCCGGGELVEILQTSGVSYYHLDQDKKPQQLWRAPLQFRRIVEEFQPDIVHCHMMTGVVLAKAVQMSSRYGLVAHLHNVHQPSAVLMGLAHRVIAVSEAVSIDMQRRGIPKQKLRVVLNGTLGSLRTRDAYSSPARELSHPAIVTVAGMNHRKGIAELITAFEIVASAIPDAHLYLVGNGPDRQEFESQAFASQFRSNIHFEGFQSNPVPYMQAADIFVLASQRDACPLVLPEARECGCAIVATNVDGIPEALDAGRAGLLVPPRNVPALASAILNVLSDSHEQDRLKTAAQLNLESFTVDRVAKELSVVYSELLAWRSLGSAWTAQAGRGAVAQTTTK